MSQALCFDTKRLIIGQALRGFDGGSAAGKDFAFTQPLHDLPSEPALLEVDLPDFWSYFYLGDGVDGEEGIGKGQPRAARVDAGDASQSWKRTHDDDLLAVLTAHAAKPGALLGFSFHLGNPLNFSEDAGGRTVHQPDGTDRPMTAADLLQVANPATEAGQRWRGALDRSAEIIKEINKRLAQLPQPREAVVLFRPLHESNQDVFWWGLWGQAPFQVLWQATFDHLTNHHGLHNLLWVFSATGKIGKPPLDDFLTHYPGDKLVDIVGMDLYSDKLDDVDGWYGALSKTNKLLGLTEYGPNHNGNGVNQPNGVVRAVIHNRYPSLVLATCWYSDHAGNRYQTADKDDPAALLDDPWAVTV
jgi:beta-mannanase